MSGALKRLAALVGNPEARQLIAGALARGAFADVRRMAHTLSSRPDRRSEKVVSRTHKFVCVCIPKAGSTSLINALLNAAPDAEVFRLSIDELLASRPETRDYFSFALLRHPFARSLSLYEELSSSEAVYDADYENHRQTGTRVVDPTDGRSFRLRAPVAETAAPARKAEKRRRMASRCYGLREVASFDDFCDWLCTPFGADAHADRHYLSQCAHLRRADGRRPDVIGQLEQADTVLEAVARQLGMPKPALPRLNTMAGWHVAPAKLAKAQSAANAQLTERNKALLRKRYAEDFALGGYRADE